MKRLLLRCCLLLAALVLGGCAANQVRGYQNTYQGYNIPQALLDRIAVSLREAGLATAAIKRDNVGRVQLTGSYRDDDEVDRAFIIVQSIVGLKSTSPFYPDQVKEKRWEVEAARALAERGRKQAARPQAAQKRALVVGISQFLDGTNIKTIQGEDDAALVRDVLQRAGYQVTALLGSQATKVAIERAVVKMKAELGANDDLFIYVSSHGTMPLPSRRGKDERRMSIVAYDTGDIGRLGLKDTALQIKVHETSVSDTLVQQLAAMPARVRRVFIDTCFSGEILKDLPPDSRDYILRTNGGQVERAGVSIPAWTGAEFTSKAIHFTADAQPTGAGAGARKAPAALPTERTGYAIITATSEGQESLGPLVNPGVFDSPAVPGRKLRGSFFTQAYFDYLGLHGGQMEQAFADASRFTAQKALDVTKGRQQQVPRQFSTIPAPQNNLFR